jgi:hypothetical protein
VAGDVAHHALKLGEQLPLARLCRLPPCQPRRHWSPQSRIWIRTPRRCEIDDFPRSRENASPPRSVKFNRQPIMRKSGSRVFYKAPVRNFRSVCARIRPEIILSSLRSGSLRSAYSRNRFYTIRCRNQAENPCCTQAGTPSPDLPAKYRNKGRSTSLRASIIDRFANARCAPACCTWARNPAVGRFSECLDLRIPTFRQRHMRARELLGDMSDSVGPRLRSSDNNRPRRPFLALLPVPGRRQEVGQ